MNKTNLFLNSPEYNARVDWEKGKVIIDPPRRGKEDNYGNWILPPPIRLSKGTSSRFANLRDTTRRGFKKDFEDFVSEFGLLGITGLPTKNDIPFMSPKYGKSQEEDVSWWLHYANVTYRLLRLYRILKRAKEYPEYDWESALGRILVFEQDRQISYVAQLQEDGKYTWTKREKDTPFVKAIWSENREETGQRFSDINLLIPYDIDNARLDAASYVLASVISRGIAGGITIGKGEVHPSKKSPIGYAITEQRYTDYLLAAIFYDLWELITDSQPVEVCANPNCLLLFTPERKTGEYCGPACRQAAYRERKAKALELYKKGLSIEQIAKETGSKAKAVSQWIREASKNSQ